MAAATSPRSADDRRDDDARALAAAIDLTDADTVVGLDGPTSANEARANAPTAKAPLRGAPSASHQQAATTGVITEDVRIPVDLGVELAATWHHPAGSPRGVAVVAPGLAVPGKVMAGVCDALAGAGWQALRIDFRGIGASRDGDLRANDDDLRDHGVRDLDGALEFAAHAARDGDGQALPMVLVGHSAGAWLVAFAQAAQRLDAVVSLASYSGHWRFHKRDKQPLLAALWYGVVPLTTRLFGLFPGKRLGLGEDAPARVVRQWARWNKRRNFFFDDADVADDLAIDLLTAPVRNYLPTDDEWGTHTAAEAMWGRFPNARHDLVDVDPADHGLDRIGHLGLMRPSAAPIWADAIRWLDQVVPSGR